MTGRLDSRALGQFAAVAETLSFRQAAEMLHVSQPPLSRAIGQLETRLGTRLFERDTRRVALTAAGRQLLPYARRILRLLSEAEAAVAVPQVPATLRLGMTTAVEAPWWQALAAALERQDVVIDLVTDTSPRLARLLARGRLDAALLAMPVRAPGLQLTQVDRQPLVAALPAQHVLAGRRKLALADLSGDALFWFRRARQPAFFDHCHAVFARHGFAPRLLEEPADHHVLLAQVAAGRGVALLPASFATLRRPGVCYKRLREGDELAVGIGLATLPDRPKVTALLRDMLAQVGASSPRQRPSGAPRARRARSNP